MMENEVKVNVRFSEVDSMQIAHNAAYYIWFEDGRFDFADRVLGFGTKDLNEDILLPVVRSGCKYLLNIHFGETLTLKTFLYIGETTKITFYYELYKNNGMLAAVGFTEHALITDKGKMLFRFPQYVKDKFNAAQQKCPDYFFNTNQKEEFERRLNR